MAKHIHLKSYLLLLAYLTLFIVGLSLNPFQTIRTSATDSPNLFIQDDLENGQILKVNSLEDWTQNILKINNNRNLTLNFLSGLLIFDEIITYPEHNSGLHFNTPKICFKFPLSEHNEEG